jgi:hypothetical protein
MLPAGVARAATTVSHPGLRGTPPGQGQLPPETWSPFDPGLTMCLSFNVVARVGETPNRGWVMGRQPGFFDMNARGRELCAKGDHPEGVSPRLAV